MGFYLSRHDGEGVAEDPSAIGSRVNAAGCGEVVRVIGEPSTRILIPEVLEECALLNHRRASIS